MNGRLPLPRVAPAVRAQLYRPALASEPLISIDIPACKLIAKEPVAARTTNFAVTPDNGTQSYWIAVDDQDVILANGSGSVDLDDSQNHFLTWWFLGNPGSTLAIMGKVSGKTVVEVQQSTIPDSQIHGGGVKRFALS